MSVILTGIHTLAQHVFHLQIQPEDYRPNCCPDCGLSGLWFHGSYTRKANRRGLEHETDEVILIPRYRCPGCRKTCSVLPEAIPPRRHYLWDVQQLVLFLLASGISINKTAKLFTPSRQTIQRWWKHVQNNFTQQAAALRSRFPSLGRTLGLQDFWLTCLGRMNLSSAMVHLHQSGLPVP